jgi:hypothetical protein
MAKRGQPKIGVIELNGSMAGGENISAGGEIGGNRKRESVAAYIGKRLAAKCGGPEHPRRRQSAE